MWRTGIGFGQQAAETRRGPSAPVPVVAALSTDIVPVELTVRSSPALTPERVVAVPASTNMSSPAPLPVTVVAPPLRTANIVAALRSEEHTSELQSLMRISYAVFCLKKKKNNQ